jgi:hypothetical protein
MSITATNLFMNWSPATITPAGGSAITQDEVTNVEIDGKSVQEVFYGDNRKFPKLIRNTAKTRKLVIETGNIGKALTIPEDTPCTIVVTLCDAVNGTTTAGGAIVITAKNAILETKPFKGANNKFAGSTLTFNCYGDDSVTPDSDPITVANA